jgi:hypothetical protein
MKIRPPVLVVAWSLVASSASCFAQDSENFPDAALTAEQWRQRMQDAQRRSEEFVANARAQTADPATSDKEDAAAADQRAMNDPGLQRGDIIATSKGFLVFIDQTGSRIECRSGGRYGATPPAIAGIEVVPGGDFRRLCWRELGQIRPSLCGAGSITSIVPRPC